MTPSFLRLDRDSVLVVFRLLRVRDILNLRQTCRFYRSFTKEKDVWVQALKEVVSTSIQPVPLPVRLGAASLAHLTNKQLEIITRRAAHLSSTWSADDADDHCIIKMEASRKIRIGRSVTWLHLIFARWLIVASSDTKTSTLTCWDLASYDRPVVESFLAGPVKSGQLRHMSDGKIIMALGVDTRVPTVQILSFGQRDGKPSFGHIHELRGFSYVKELSEDMIVCAMKDDIAIPHVVWWKTGESMALSERPENTGTDITAKFWKNFLMTAGTNHLRIYVFSVDSQSLSHRQTIRLDCDFASEVVFLGHQLGGPDAPCAFDGWIKPDDGGLDVFLTGETDNQPSMDIYRLQYDGASASFSFGRKRGEPALDYSSRGFVTGDTGSRLFSFSRDRSSFVAVRPNLLWSEDEPGISEVPVTDPVDDDDIYCSFPALWAFPVMSFDEAIGLLAVGNIFGELAVFDLVPDGPEAFNMIKDLPLCEESHNSTSPSFSDQTPLTLDVIPCYYVPHGKSPSPEEDEAGFASASSKFYRCERVELRPRWTNNWRDYYEWSQWEGHPEDRAFLLFHRNHFIGRPELIMFNLQCVVFRVGGVYMAWDDADDNPAVLSEITALRGLLKSLKDEEGSIDALPRVLPHHDQVADSLYQEWDAWLRFEANHDRNRWMEMKERGGFPPEAYTQAPQME
ncbi:hypothetical protein F5I97DRAFT_1640317 [Phlebopus sp. FC_14]|nr:hypothetical protein F5I97DRAFT_1640317 [Phlebopus sp. FC_14]